MPTEKVFLAKTAWDALNRLNEKSVDFTVGNNASDDAMLSIFFNSDWVDRSDADAGQKNTQGHVKKYSITNKGRQILAKCEVVSDTDPRAVGLNKLFV